MTAPTRKPPAPSDSPWLGWLGRCGLFLLLWVSLIKLPAPASIDLDPSWQMVLGEAAAQNLQHGKDIVFTYGPLGYVSRSSAYVEAMFTSHVAWQLVSNVFLAAGLMIFGQMLPGWRRVVYYAYLFCYGTSYPDAMHMNFITIFGLMLVAEERRSHSWVAITALILAVFGLIKFTNLVLCLFVVATVCGYFLWRGFRRDAFLLGLGFPTAFVAGWMICGQALENLPAFLHYGQELSTGYVEAMAYYETPLVLTLGLASAGSVAIYCALFYFTSRDRMRAFCAGAIVAAVIFLNFKHGYVRADGHVFGHYVMVLLIVCTHPALVRDNARLAGAKNAVLAFGGAVCLFGIAQFHLPTLLQAPSMWNYRVRDTVVALVDLPAYRQRLNLERDDAAALANKPAIRAFVGNETLDHLGSDQGQTVLNRFNYTPRPAIQGYTTYTPDLNKLDEAFYLSARAPRFVVQRYQSIDERLISLDDSLSLRRLFQNYDYVLEEGGLILWERPQRIIVPPEDAEPVLFTRKVALGERIPVPADDRPLWASIQLEPSLLGRLRTFLYKPPLLTIDVEDDQGRVHALRFVRRMGAAGFILQPFFNSGDDLIAYQLGKEPVRVRSLTLRTEPGWEKYFQPDFQLELRALAPFTRASEGLKPSAPHRFRMMNRPPQRLRANTPAIDTLIDGKHLLQMHPVSVMEFDLDAPVSEVSAAFGIMPDAFKSAAAGTDGVEFIVDWVAPDGRVEVLHRRLLDPLRRPEDRPRQSLQITFPPKSSGVLRLRTEPGVSGQLAFAWSYWTDIVIR